MNKNILVASQKHMISEGVYLQLKQEFGVHVVYWAQNVEQFEKMYNVHAPNAVVMWAQFNGTNTPGYIRDFMSREVDARFVMVADSVQRHKVVEIMESGATGFVSPADGGFDEMIAAVRSVANGNTYVCQKAAESLFGGLFNRNQPVENETLSDREKQVIRLVSDGHSSKEIARILMISPSTVEVHRRNIMRKIGVHKTAELTRYAIRAELVSI